MQAFGGYGWADSFKTDVLVGGGGRELFSIIFANGFRFGVSIKVANGISINDPLGSYFLLRLGDTTITREPTVLISK